MTVLNKSMHSYNEKTTTLCETENKEFVIEITLVWSWCGIKKKKAIVSHLGMYYFLYLHLHLCYSYLNFYSDHKECNADFRFSLTNMYNDSLFLFMFEFWPNISKFWVVYKLSSIEHNYTKGNGYHSCPE